MFCYNYKVGQTNVENRTFQIEFWEDSHGLKWVEVSEIIHTKKFIMRCGHRVGEIPKVEKRIIRQCWTNGNRLALGRQLIEEYLQEEKVAAAEQREIEEFCANGGTDGS